MKNNQPNLLSVVSAGVTCSMSGAVIFEHANEKFKTGSTGNLGRR